MWRGWGGEGDDVTAANRVVSVPKELHLDYIVAAANLKAFCCVSATVRYEPFSVWQFLFSKTHCVLSGYYFCAVLREGIHSVGPVHCARGAHPAAVPGLFPGEWFLSQPSVTYQNQFVVF